MAFLSWFSFRNIGISGDKFSNFLCCDPLEDTFIFSSVSYSALLRLLRLALLWFSKWTNEMKSEAITKNNVQSIYWWFEVETNKISQRTHSFKMYLYVENRIPEFNRNSFKNITRLTSFLPPQNTTFPFHHFKITWTDIILIHSIVTDYSLYSLVIIFNK